MTDTTRTSRVFLDSGGRARWHPLAREAFERALDDGWADPNRVHAEGRRARALLDAARESLATSLGARTDEIRLHHSHAASLRAAVRAVATARRGRGDVVLSAVERDVLLDVAADRATPTSTDKDAHDTRFTAGEVRPGHPAPRRIVIDVDRWGRVDASTMGEAITMPSTGLAVLQLANGEVGTRQPVEAVHAVAARSDVPLLVDAGAATGHLRLPNTWDLLAADPADWGAGPGVGVLAVRPRVRWRSTEPDDPWFSDGICVPAAFAAAVGLEAALSDLKAQDARRRDLVALIRKRASAIADVEVLGDPDDRLPHVVTVSFLYVDGEALLAELDREGVAVGSGSACASGTGAPSHVLAAMGALTHGNVRIALDRSTTAEDVSRLLDVLPSAVERVRRMLGAP